MACGDDAFGDGGDLAGRLSRPKDDLRETLAEAAVVIDAGEAQILERGLAQKLKKAVVGCLRREAPGLDVVQEGRGARRRFIDRESWHVR